MPIDVITLLRRLAGEEFNFNHVTKTIWPIRNAINKKETTKLIEYACSRRARYSQTLVNLEKKKKKC